jgi:hypothetical protein
MMPIFSCQEGEGNSRETQGIEVFIRHCNSTEGL